MNHPFTLARFSGKCMIPISSIAPQTHARARVIVLHTTRHIYDTHSVSVCRSFDWSSHPLRSVLRTSNGERPRFQDRNHETCDHFSSTHPRYGYVTQRWWWLVGMCERHLLGSVSHPLRVRRAVPTESLTYDCERAHVLDDMKCFLLLFSV